MKLLEIHKNGINAHNNEVSFYGIDFQTKTLMFDGIENVECAIEIAFRSKYRSNVEAEPDDEQIEQYILNFPAAKRKQSEMRKRKIQNAYKEMQDAINRYNEVIEKYFDKPLTSDSEVEIINC